MKRDMYIGVFMISASQEYSVTSHTGDWGNWNMSKKKQVPSLQ